MTDPRKGEGTLRVTPRTRMDRRQRHDEILATALRLAPDLGWWSQWPNALIAVPTGVDIAAMAAAWGRAA